MSDAGYEFADGVPIDPIGPGTTLLVAGPALSRAEDLARTMVVDAVGREEGMLFVSTNTTCGTLLDTCRRDRPSLDPARMGVVDCSGQDIGGSSPMRVKYVSTQSDLTGIGMKFSSLYEALYGEVSAGRIRCGLISLSSLAMYVDLRKLFRFAQTISGRIDSADGLGVFSLDPTTHDTREVNTLSQAADGRIEVRDPEEHPDADGELRVRGLRDRSEEWRPFSL